MIKYSEEIRYTTYIRVFEKYHMRLHASVINLHSRLSKGVRYSATFEGLALGW